MSLGHQETKTDLGPISLGRLIERGRTLTDQRAMARINESARPVTENMGVTKENHQHGLSHMRLFRYRIDIIEQKTIAKSAIGSIIIRDHLTSVMGYI